MAKAKQASTNRTVQGPPPVIDLTEQSGTPRLMTIREVAERLAVSTKTVYRLRNEGALPHLKVRGSLRFRESDVAVLEARSLVTGSRYADVEIAAPPRLNLQFEVRKKRGRGPRRA